jgi:DNA-binding response OmpR family regulator
MMRILLAEDEFLVGLVLEDDLRRAGYAVSGPFATLASAMEAARREVFDLAVLDINLGGEMVFPLADELEARGIPYILLSGYSAMHLPERFRSAPRSAKPHDPASLIREVQRLVS